jgi:hypothetical protein
MAQPSQPAPSPSPAPNYVAPPGYAPQALSPGPTPPSKKSRTTLYVVGVVVVVAVIALVAILASGALSPKSSPSAGGPGALPPAEVQVAASGTVWNLNAGNYEYVGAVSLTSNSSWTISGTFTATNGITAYVMTSSEYSAWGGSGSPSAYSWTSGSVTSGAVNTYLYAGTYYFVWDNTNTFTSTSVEITSNVIATASG